MWLVVLAADQVRILIGFEIRQAHDDGLGRKRGRDLCDAFAQLVDIEIHGPVVARDLLGNGILEFGALLVVFQQRSRMHADHAIDDELETREAHAAMRYARKIERPVRIADIHGDLNGNLGHGIHFDAALIEFQHALINVAGIAFGAGNRNRLVFLDVGGGRAAADHRRNAQLAGDDGRMAGAAAAIRDDRRGALHDRLPIRVGHVSDQHVAGPDPRHFFRVLDDSRVARADPLSDAASAGQYLGTCLQRKSQYRAPGTALHGFRTGLQNVNFAVAAILAPLDVHGRAVMFLDDERLLRQFRDVCVAERETVPVCGRYVDGAHALFGVRIGVDHLDRFAAEILSDDRAAARAQRRLVNVELIRIDGALHHGLAQAISGRDKDHIAEARIRIQREHDAGRAQVAAHHVLHADRERHGAVIEFVVHAVGYGAIVEQRGVHFVHGLEQMLLAAHVEECLLLAGE